MDTPEKSQISTASLSKFEDSPVFNYINSLSPIKPVKSIHITQTFHSLSFASLPSVFTSPHVISHKESRFLRRHNQVDPLKPEFFSENENKVGSNEGVVEVAQLFNNNSAELQENFDPAVSTTEASMEPPSEHLKFAIELPRMLRYDCGSPDCDPTPRCGTVDSVSELADTSASLVPFVKEATQNSFPNGEVPVEELQQDEKRKENTDIEWESLMSDAADLLVFNPPMDTDAFKGRLLQKSLDPAAACCTSLSEMHRIQIVHPIGSGEKPVNQTEDNNIAAIGDPNKCIAHNPGSEMENEAEKPNPFASKVACSLHRGMRRRCLDFEMVGARRKNLDGVTNSRSCLVVQTDEKVASKDEQSLPHKPANDSSRCILPGIGLHLNALGIASSDGKNVKHETSSSGVSLSILAASFKSGTTGQELNELLTLPSTEGDMDPAENDGLMSEDVSPAPGQLVSEEFNQSSPKKKRRRLEGEGEACKRCNCKKSKCLKLYCECFAAGVYCIEPCACVDCFNKPIHEDTVLATRKQIESRNPLAFAPKVIRSAESVPEIGDEPSKTPASARHKRGCNCKKSNCLKKYCECYQGGVGCSFNCRCEGCKNAFGRKDGSTLMETDAEPENETETCEKSVVDNISQKTEIHNNEEQNLDGALPTTPLRLCRPFVELPFSSKSKPPRTFFGIGSSSGLYTGQRYGKPNFLQPESRFENQFQTFPDNDIPEILRADYCSSTGIKSSSPNSKRISPPQNELGSHSRRGGRKLILQSIPSFPSLTPKH